MFIFVYFPFQSDTEEPPTQSISGRPIAYLMPSPIVPNIGFTDRTPAQAFAAMSRGAPAARKAKTKTAAIRKRKANVPAARPTQAPKRHRALLKQPARPSDPDYFSEPSPPRQVIIA